MGDTYMDEIYKSDDELDKHENKSEVTIQMSEVYTKSMCDLGTTTIRNYLKSFSHRNVPKEEKLPCLKQKYEKKCKFHQLMNPYCRNKNYEKYTEPRSHFSYDSMHPQSQFYSLEHKKKKEKTTDNSRSLKVKNSNGTIDITLKPIVLIHVRDIPAERSHVSPSQSSNLKTDSNILPGDYESPLRVYDANKNHREANVLRVKSSCNSTDLSSARKISSMKMIGDILVTPPANFRRPNNFNVYRCGSCCRSKMSSTDSSSFLRVYLERDSSSEFKSFLKSFSGDLDENKDSVGVSPNEPKVDCSVQTIFRRPIITDSILKTLGTTTSRNPRSSVGHFQGEPLEQPFEEEISNQID